MSTDIRAALATVWNNQMHDGNGEHVTNAFIQTMREVKAARESGNPFEPFEFHNKVIGCAFDVNDAPDTGVWLACASNTVSDMAAEFARMIAARKAGSEPAE